MFGFSLKILLIRWVLPTPTHHQLAQHTWDLLNQYNTQGMLSNVR